MKTTQKTLIKPALDEADAVKALGALAQAHRLRVFRALVVAGPEGRTPGALGAALDVAPSALSFHLKELSIAGLASGEQRGRNIVYRASFERMNDLLAYLTEHCCQGKECESTNAASCCDPD